ncbi:hypothetical protein [Thermococcus sp. 21S7]|uniref:hypothetical protein n=1 Tax=Thermococcus sp. 21S7 TaxID=1638221 RepID=UPI00143A9BB7|nr:hypothetical protein [Thermococcus sp. 21S7]NJE61544.1 hypothetical protein [Thermococcus sp. 21S7]
MRSRKLLGVLLLGGLLFGLVSAWRPLVPTATSPCKEVWDHDVDEKSWGASKLVWVGVHAKVLVCNGSFVRIIIDPTPNHRSPRFVVNAQDVTVLENGKYVKDDLSEAGAWITYIDPETGKKSQVYARIPHLWPRRQEVNL